MAGLISRGLSAVVGLTYLLAAVLSGAPPDALIVLALYLILPLACIWFPEEMGVFTGVVRGHQVTSESPGCLVAAGGWLLLLLPLIIGCIWYLQERGS